MLGGEYILLVGASLPKLLYPRLGLLPLHAPSMLENTQQSVLPQAENGAWCRCSLIDLDFPSHGHLSTHVEAALLLLPESVEEGAVTKDQVLHILLRLAILKEKFSW